MARVQSIYPDATDRRTANILKLGMQVFDLRGHEVSESFPFETLVHHCFPVCLCRTVPPCRSAGLFVKQPGHGSRGWILDISFIKGVRWPGRAALILAASTPSITLKNMQL